MSTTIPRAFSIFCILVGKIVLENDRSIHYTVSLYFYRTIPGSNLTKFHLRKLFMEKVITTNLADFNGALGAPLTYGRSCCTVVVVASVTPFLANTESIR